MFKHIVVPYDHSLPSQNALKIALEVAKTHKSTLHLLNVIPEVMLPNYFGRDQLKKTIKEYEKEIYAELKKNALDLLESQKKKSESMGIETEIKTAYGGTTKEILEFVKKNKVDLVVIGTTSRKGLSRIRALGSVARKISEEAPCPVLLVH